MENDKIAYYDFEKKEWSGWFPEQLNKECFNKYKCVHFLPYEEYNKKQVWDDEGCLYCYRLKYNGETFFNLPVLLTEEDCLKIIDFIKIVKGEEEGAKYSYSTWITSIIDESINVEETIKENGDIIVNMWY